MFRYKINKLNNLTGGERDVLITDGTRTFEIKYNERIPLELEVNKEGTLPKEIGDKLFDQDTFHIVVEPEHFMKLKSLYFNKINNINKSTYIPSVEYNPQPVDKTPVLITNGANEEISIPFEYVTKLEVAVGREPTLPKEIGDKLFNGVKKITVDERPFFKIMRLYSDIRNSEI